MKDAPSGLRSAPPSVAPLDEDGLLCAMVLAPSTYSRNRFFRLFEQPKMRHVQRRARLVRGLARQATRGADGPPKVLAAAEERLEVEITIPALGFRRRALLTALEHDLFVYLLHRARPGQADGDDLSGLRSAPPEVAGARARVERALSRLSGLAIPLGLEQDSADQPPVRET